METEDEKLCAVLSKFSFYYQFDSDLVKHIFHLAWSPDTLPTSEAVVPLVRFLDTAFKSCNRKLLKDNYFRFLHLTWQSVLRHLKDHADSTTTGVRSKLYN